MFDNSNSKFHAKTQRRKENRSSLRLCELCVRLLFPVAMVNPYSTEYFDFDSDGLVYNGERRSLGTSQKLFAPVHELLSGDRCD